MHNLKITQLQKKILLIHLNIYNRKYICKYALFVDLLTNVKHNTVNKTAKYDATNVYENVVYNI